MSDRNPLAYTGRVSGSTKVQGDVQFDATDFSVVNGVVSLGGTGNVENLVPDSGSVTPAAGLLNIAGTANQLASAGSGSTITFSLNDGIPQYAAVSITAAQVKLLATTPIQLVAAPAAGKMIKFMGASFKLVYGSEVFAETADNLGIKYTDAAGFQVSNDIECTGFIDQAADTYNNAEPATDAIVAASACEAKALVLDNINDNFTGNASDDSTLEVSVCYRIVTI